MRDRTGAVVRRYRDDSGVPNYRAEARRAALRYGLDPRIFQRQIGAESGFDPTARSPAGAIGIAQFMPGTARGVGVNPRNPVASLNAAAKLMAGYVRKYGSYRNALVAYNAGPGRVGGPLPGETQRYIARILGGSTGQTSVGGSAQALVSAGGSSGMSMPVGSEGLVPLLKALGQQRSAPSSMGLASPAFSAQPALPAGFQQALSGGGPSPKPDVSQLLALVQTAGGDVPQGGAGVGGALGGVSSPSGGLPGNLGRAGVARFDGKPVAAWIAPALAYARAHGWKGTVTSGYRSYAEQKRIYDSGVRPAAKPGQSNHQGTQFPRGAVDVSNAAQLAAILRGSRWEKLLRWAGAKDPVHFSHPHGGSY